MVKSYFFEISCGYLSACSTPISLTYFESLLPSSQHHQPHNAPHNQQADAPIPVLVDEVTPRLLAAVLGPLGRGTDPAQQAQDNALEYGLKNAFKDGFEEAHGEKVIDTRAHEASRRGLPSAMVRGK